MAKKKIFPRGINSTDDLNSGDLIPDTAATLERGQRIKDLREFMKMGDKVCRAIFEWAAQPVGLRSVVINELFELENQEKTVND